MGSLGMATRPLLCFLNYVIIVFFQLLNYCVYQ